MFSKIEHNGDYFPALQSTGNAAKFAIPFAKEICSGVGYDIGYCKEEWKLPHAIGIEPTIDNRFNATKLPEQKVDFIFSSHCLEHCEGRFQDVIEYWLTCLKKDGVIFLYLPNCDYQKYWAFGNKKHIHYLSPTILSGYCSYIFGQKLIKNFMVTDGYDLNGSFYCIIEK